MLYVATPFLGFACAVLLGRYTDIRQRLNRPATLTLGATGAILAGFVFIGTLENPWQTLLVVATSALSATAFIFGGALADERAITPIRARIEARQSDQNFSEKAEQWVYSKSPMAAGLNVARVGIGVGRRAGRVRLPGLAAEMSYYGLISFAPLLTSIGASMGYMERVIGEEQTAAIESALIHTVSGIFAQDVADDVFEPLIEGLLRDERAGFAISSLAIALWLGSRVFRAAIRALDDAYDVSDRSGFFSQQIRGFGFVIGLLLTVLIVLSLIVVGPLFGDGQQIADWLGLGSIFAWSWAILRWPIAASAFVAFLALLYRYGPNITTTWRRSMPGAVVGSICLLAVVVGFSIYLEITGATLSGFDATEDTSVSIAAQMVGLVLAVALFLWLCSMMIILGGLLNAELDHQRAAEADAAAST